MKLWHYITLRISPMLILTNGRGEHWHIMQAVWNFMKHSLLFIKINSSCETDFNNGKLPQAQRILIYNKRIISDGSKYARRITVAMVFSIPMVDLIISVSFDNLLSSCLKWVIPRIYYAFCAQKTHIISIFQVTLYNWK